VLSVVDSLTWRPCSSSIEHLRASLCPKKQLSTMSEAAAFFANKKKKKKAFKFNANLVDATSVTPKDHM
jgi:hypothetical protein